MMHVVMRLRAYEASLPHDDSRGCEVLHPVASLKLVSHSNLRLHLDFLTIPSFILFYDYPRFIIFDIFS